jgi:hypothetical protein
MSREVRFEPVEVLVHYDGPQTFTFRHENGLLMLAHLLFAEDDGQKARYVAVPFDEEGVRLLKDGRMTVRDALEEQRWVFLATGEPWSSAMIEPVKLASLPAEVLPERYAMLSADLLPLLSLRLKGDGVHADSVPVYVVRQAVTATESAIKTISGYVAETSSAPHADALVEPLRNLNVQRLGFASFEVALRGDRSKIKFDPGDPSNPFTRVRKLLTGAVRAATEKPDKLDFGAQFDHETEEGGRVALDAIHDMTPPNSGPVEESEVSGRLVGGARSYDMDRFARVYLRGFLRPKSEETVEIVGVIDKPSNKSRTFNVVPASARSERFSYDEEFFAEIVEAFRSKVAQRVVGRKPIRGPVRLLAILSNKQA